MMNKLPLPTETEVDTHQALVEKLRNFSQLNENWISFSSFMEIVLYDKECGYYIKKKNNFGSLGDFVTAPMISDLFAETFLKQFSVIFNKTKSMVLELGPGNGFFCRDMLNASEEEGVEIEKYYLLEIGLKSIENQKITLQQSLSEETYRKIEWVTEIPDKFTGVVFMNEFIDALPVDIFKVQDNKIVQKGLKFQDNNLVWAYKNASLEMPKNLIYPLPNGYVFEHSFLYEKWINQLNSSISKGAVFIVDYGFTNHEYFHPDRNEGTLMCHYQHMAHTDPLINLGSQDITSHVNFSYLAELFNKNNFMIEGFLSQANFLINSGILDGLKKYNPNDILNYSKKSMELQKLVSPAEMGDLVKVMVVTKNIDIDFHCFKSFDKSFQL